MAAAPFTPPPGIAATPQWRAAKWSRAGACPCGAGQRFTACCQPFLDDVAIAPSPKQLMRSRFTATCLADGEYLLRTWHPATRPDTVPTTLVEASALEIYDTAGATGLDVVKGATGTVTFRATLWQARGEGTQLTEKSVFEFRAGRWLYRDGEAHWSAV